MYHHPDSRFDPIQPRLGRQDFRLFVHDMRPDLSDEDIDELWDSLMREKRRKAMQ